MGFLNGPGLAGIGDALQSGGNFVQLQSQLKQKQAIEKANLAHQQVLEQLAVDKAKDEQQAAQDAHQTFLDNQAKTQQQKVKDTEAAMGVNGSSSDPAVIRLLQGQQNVQTNPAVSVNDPTVNQGITQAPGTPVSPLAIPLAPGANGSPAPANTAGPAAGPVSAPAPAPSPLAIRMAPTDLGGTPLPQTQTQITPAAVQYLGTLDEQKLAAARQQAVARYTAANQPGLASAAAVANPAELGTIEEKFLALTKPKQAAPPELGSFADYLSRYATAHNKTPDQLTPDDITQAQTQFNKSGIDAGIAKYEAEHPQNTDNDVAMTPDAIAVAAKRYNQDGTLPPMGMGKVGASNRIQIMNMAAKLDPNAAIAANKAQLNSDTASLKNIQKTYDASTAFSNTLDKNLTLLKQSAGDVVDTGSPFLNQPLRLIDKRIFGANGQVAYDVYTQTVISEASKILTSPQGTGNLTDQARKDMEAAVAPGATLGQIMTAGNALETDAKNKRDSYQQQIDVIKGRIKNYNVSPETKTSKYQVSIQ